MVGIKGPADRMFLVQPVTKVLVVAAAEQCRAGVGAKNGPKIDAPDPKSSIAA